MNSIHFKRFIQFTPLLLLSFGLNRQQTTSSNGMQTGLSCNITINGTCYIYVSTRMKWSDAEDNCISMGGHLASIHSDAENTALQGIRPNVTGLTSNLTGSSKNRPYIGCNDVMSEGNYSWIDGSYFSYTNWAPGRPNNNKGGQDCCAYQFNSDEWNDRKCTMKLHSICKVTGYESTPDNTQTTTTSSIQPTIQPTITVTTTPSTTSTTAQPTTSTTTPPNTITNTQPTTITTTQPSTSSSTPPSTITTTQPSTSSTTQPSTSTTTQPTSSSTTPPSTGTTTQPTTITTTQPTTITTTQPSPGTSTQPTTINTTVSLTVQSVQPTTITTNLATTSTTTAMPASNITTIPITEEPPVNASEARDSLLNKIEDTIIQPESLISVNMINNILEEASKLIEYSTQQISQNQSEFMDDVILITRLIDVISQQVYYITQNSSDDPIRFEINSIKLQIDLVSTQDLISNNSTNIGISFPTTSDDAGIETTDTAVIPTSLLLPLITSNDSRIIITSSLIQVKLNEEEPLRLNQIASNIFGLSITGIKPGENLKQPIQMKFQTKTIINFPLCSFLMEDSSYWSQSGVELIKTTLNMIVCETSHLTSFAVLAGSMTQPSTDIEGVALSISSYVLLSLSLLFMVASIVAYLVSYKTIFKAEINILYFNFSIALSIAILAFFISNIIDKAATIEILCGIMAFLVHYTWINVFTSGTACSISLTYALTITLLGGKRKKIFPYLIVASWGLPLLVTVPTVAIGVFHNHAYSTSNGICMLSSKNSLIASFYAPILLLILLNIILLMVILFLLWKAYRIQDKNVNELLLFKKLITSTLILFPILGLPFLLVPIIAHVNISNSAIDWIFIFLYCPIGIAFFLLVTLRNSDISHHCSKLCRKATNKDLEANVPGNDEEMKVYQNFFAFFTMSSEQHVKRSNL